jgi:hypothetical protein
MCIAINCAILDQTKSYAWDTTKGNHTYFSDTGAETFLRAEPSRLRAVVGTQFGTQGTSFLTSTDASSSSFFALHPDFHFNLHSVTPLSALCDNNSVLGKVSVLLCVLEVDGLDTVSIRKGVHTGQTISILKLILGDDDGYVCKLTAWGDVAETWGGSIQALGIKRGDVVCFESTH